MPRFAILLVACSGSSTDDTPFVGPETCDNGVDDNGNGLVDCADTDFCGGLACATGDDDDDDTGEPLAPVEVVYSAEDCCDFIIDTECPKSLGTVGVVNRTTEEAVLDASCDLVDGESPIVWQIKGGDDPPEAFIVNAPVSATTELTLEAFYNCAVTHGFVTTCRVKIDTEEEEADVEFDVTATPQ